MPKRGKKSAGRPVETYGSDDERAYDRETVPDTEDADYYDDEVSQFHDEKEKILLNEGATLETADTESEEEVLAFDDDSSDEEDTKYHEMKQRLKEFRSRGHHQKMASDLEDEEDEDKPEQGDQHKTWGSAREKFYGGHDSDVDEDLSGSEPEAAALEEQEALAIQQRLLQDMDEDDIGLDIFKPVASAEISSSEKITQDLTKLSHRDKVQLLKKQSPELLDLLADNKQRLAELQTQLLPAYRLISDKKLSKQTNGAKLIISKVEVYLNYLMNFSYYLMLKAKQTPVEHHPVIKRLLQYRNIMKQLDSLEPKVKPELDALLQRIQLDEQFSSVEESSEEDAAEQTKPVFRSQLLNRKKKLPHLTGKKRLSEMLQDSDGEADISKGGKTWGRKRSRTVIQEDDVRAAQIVEEDPEVDSADININPEAPDEQDERRGINYQIEKNKGLTPRKRKELRNPRVKNKLKYRKAKIRRRGQVREVRTEMVKYGGEISGIRAGIKKSVKFK